MHKRKDYNRWLVVGIASLLAFVTACSRDDTGAPAGQAAQQQAARDNVEAMAREHADDTTEASAGARIDPQRAVISERLPYAEVGDELVYGYFVFPSDMIEPLPAVIMIHEWWGLNDNIHAMADRLAGEGYIVLAVDLFGGKVATNAAQARELALQVVENPDSAYDNIRQAYAFVNDVAGAPRIGSLGWCFGGGWSLNTAMLFPNDLDAAVIYYGQVTDDVQQLQPVNAPILGLFGAKDTGIKVASVRAFESALESLRKTYAIHVYPNADHAFANPTGKAYNAAAADDAWQKTLEFLGRYLVAAPAVEG